MQEKLLLKQFLMVFLQMKEHIGEKVFACFCCMNNGIAFFGFSAAWNEAWQFVDRYVCMEIPKIFKEISLDENVR